MTANAHPTIILFEGNIEREAEREREQQKALFKLFAETIAYIKSQRTCTQRLAVQNKIDFVYTYIARISVGETLVNERKR